MLLSAPSDSDAGYARPPLASLEKRKKVKKKGKDKKKGSRKESREPEAVVGTSRHHDTDLGGGACNTRVVDLPVYGPLPWERGSKAETDAAQVASQSTLHLLLAPPMSVRRQLMQDAQAEAAAAVAAAECQIPFGLDPASVVRAISCLQGHNNCGRLWGATSAVLAQQSIVARSTPPSSPQLARTGKMDPTDAIESDSGHTSAVAEVGE